ncbi:phosphatase PAP2 family protein [Nodosilinea sp. LEGE 06152]|uniref:phosphatase PAP2 family protein n=1 Tax=Nodosilinea sp. LEGE 06152 TaxID=2777966 RepID=UPI00188123A1|nr:phosphatase PAP2 family protein [Nodosilinea sp. LEGE 06152]MBE9159557.1 phosphatase PAP2 family protein [Nodosilinea sp. LEGE 06152]
MSYSTLTPLKPLWLGVALPLAGLVTLGLLVAAHPTLPAWDAAFLLRLHRYASPALNQAVAIATDLGTFWGVLPASLGLMALGLWHRRWQPASYLAFVMAGSAVLNPIAKQLWHRVRPALWDGIPPHTDFSFPSGHATYSMAFVMALVLLNWENPKRPWLLGLGGLFVFCIGASRVYLGAHYPSDILGGWLLAIAWAIGLHQLMFHWGPWLRSQASS